MAHWGVGVLDLNGYGAGMERTRDPSSSGLCSDLEELELGV